MRIKSFVLERSGSNFKSLISKFIIENSSLGIRSAITVKLKPQTLTDDTLTLD